MRQFTLKMLESFDRPFVPLDKWHGLTAMIDSGARFPVWVADESLLVDLGAKIKMENAPFGGFGGRASGRLYELPHFQMGDLIYPGLNVIACPLNVPCEIIVSSTMLKHMRCTIDFEDYDLTITIPDNQSNVRNVTIEDKNGHLHVLCHSAEEGLQ